MAALALLLQQLRDKAPMADVLTSVQRLCTLARVGSVTVDVTVLREAASQESVAEGAQLLSALFDAHGLDALDIATTITDTEFLKLGGVLLGPPSDVHGSINETANALSIWNVRMRGRGVVARPTPSGMRPITPALGVHAASDRSAPASAPVSASAPAAKAAPVKTAPAPTPAGSLLANEQAIQAAVAAGDGAKLHKLLPAVQDPAQYARVATVTAMQLIAELLLDNSPHYHDLHRLLERAGMNGALAVFELLAAATEVSERRFLYDLATTLPATLEVARQRAADPTWFVARNAAGLLGEAKNPSAIPELTRLLRHADMRVRTAAVVALGQIGGPVAMARLESVLFDPNVEVRNRALSIVFASPDADLLATRVLDAGQDDFSIEYQLEVIAALSHVHTPRARAKLVEMTLPRTNALEDLQIRLAAIGALAAGHRPAADDTLRTLSKDEHALVRERASALLAG